MACFIVPGAEAVVTTVITKIVENKEHKKNKENEQKNDLLSYNNARDTDVTEATNNINRLPFSKKLKWLNNMLWGEQPCLHLNIYGMERLHRGFHF